MNRDIALEILSQAKDRLDSVRHDMRDYLEWRQDNIALIEDALIATEPFSRFGHAWFFGADGGGQALLGMLGSWVIDSLLARNDPNEIITKALDEINENEAQFCEVSPVFGAKITSKVELLPGVMLIPAEEIPLVWQAQKVTQPFNSSPFQPRDCCILVQNVSVKPGLLERKSMDIEPNYELTVTNPPLEERSKKAELARAAFLLCGGGAIEIPVRTFVRQEGKLLGPQGVRFGTIAPRYLPHSAEFSAEKVREAFLALHSFGKDDSLIRAVDRLGRARANPMIADKAIDLGMAAEIALMHDSDSSNSEIRYKISLRAAWLINDTVEGRLATCKSIRTLYDARSAAVHRGVIPSKTKFDAVIADGVVARVLNVIVANGRFPNWDLLTLGGA